MIQDRSRVLHKGKQIKGPILYWMSRDQRVSENWALKYSQDIALQYKEPLIVCFCLQPSFLGATLRQYDFMMKGLKEVNKKLKELNIPFLLKLGRPSKVIVEIINDYDISFMISDFSPLNIKKEWNKTIIENIKIPFHEVDTHNIVPCWISSSKQEYAAYTLRKKMKPKLKKFLDPLPTMKTHPFNLDKFENPVSFGKIFDKLDVDTSIKPVSWLKSGEKAALVTLNEFLEDRFSQYNEKRNDPNKDVLSNLSPYLHFGQISAQRVVLEADKIQPLRDLKGTFYDEIIVRKELSDNFCYFNSDYKTVNSFPDWAKETLKVHKNDKRKYNYSLEEFESAKTHDDAWNAAQLEMVNIGKMHGYMRMYWGKKILEWTESPEKAMNIAIYLNDKYELDGRDPNGYTGIAWCIGGIHDRAWRERKIYGKVRYMSYNGLKRKFDVQKYIANNLKRNKDE